jgi:hypothetical protein
VRHAGRKTLLQTAAGFQPRTTNSGDAPMPLPTPKPGETRDDFIPRCMTDPATQDITGATDAEAQQRRLAACYRQFTAGKMGGDGDVEAKSIGGALSVVDDEKGEIVAVVATLDTIDRDRDIIPSDAFPSGVKVKMSDYGHSSISDLMYGTGIPDKAPVGKGAIFIENGRAVFRGKYFMSTDAGREAFNTVKEMGEEQEWSFGYRILRTAAPSTELAAKGARRVLAKLGPLEVTPIMYAGGVGTRTVGVKQAGGGDGDVEEEIAEVRIVDGKPHPAEDYAYVPNEDDPSTWLFPIFDAEHVKDVLARMHELSVVPGAAIEQVRARILAAAQQFGLEVVGEAKKTASVGGVEHPMEDFAYHPDPDKPSTWKFPIFDAAHVRNALARWTQADIPEADKAAVLARIHAAAEKFKIDVAAEQKSADALDDIERAMRRTGEVLRRR